MNKNHNIYIIFLAAFVTSIIYTKDIIKSDVGDSGGEVSVRKLLSDYIESPEREILKWKNVVNVFLLSDKKINNYQFYMNLIDESADYTGLDIHIKDASEFKETSSGIVIFLGEHSRLLNILEGIYEESNNFDEIRETFKTNKCYSHVFFDKDSLYLGYILVDSSLKFPRLENCIKIGVLENLGVPKLSRSLLVTNQHEQVVEYSDAEADALRLLYLPSSKTGGDIDYILNNRKQ